MMEIGRVCIKIAGRDAGKKCVIVDLLDNNFVLIDGETRRRKCNIAHLEPTKEKLDLEKGADHASVLSMLGLESTEKKSRSAGPKPKKARKTSEPKVEVKEKKVKKK